MSQDGIASIPSWYRAFLVKLYGDRIVGLLDWLGARHDTDIARFGYILSAIIMSARLFFYLPWTLIALPISVMVFLYAILPTNLKYFTYSKLIK